MKRENEEEKKIETRHRIEMSTRCNRISNSELEIRKKMNGNNQ